MQRCGKSMNDTAAWVLWHRGPTLRQQSPQGKPEHCLRRNGPGPLSREQGLPTKPHFSTRAFRQQLKDLSTRTDKSAKLEQWCLMNFHDFARAVESSFLSEEQNGADSASTPGSRAWRIAWCARERGSSLQSRPKYLQTHRGFERKAADSGPTQDADT